MATLDAALTMALPEPWMFCRSCDYPLNNLRGARCPECGREFDIGDLDTFFVRLIDPVKLTDARDGIEADRMCGYLVCEHIAAAVADTGDTNAATLGFETAAPAVPAVWVNRSDLVRAWQALRTFVERQHGRAPWTCPNCGENLERQFSECWNCQTAHPDDETDEAR